MTARLGTYMEETRKRTDRKNQGAKKASRVVDMSWAAKYLDDDWENKYSAEGAVDTQVAMPPGEKKDREESADEEYIVNDLSDTQLFRAAFREPLPADPDDPEAQEKSKEQEKQADPEEPEEDDIRIRDAVTEETITSLEEMKAVRDAAGLAQQETDGPEEDIVRIRDAVTDKTVVSVSEARAVRTTLFHMGMDEDLDELSGIRDARNSLLRQEPAGQEVKITEKEHATAAPAEKAEEPVLFPGKTIVASKTADSVRKAASRIEEEVLPVQSAAQEIDVDPEDFIEEKEKSRSARKERSEPRRRRSTEAQNRTSERRTRERADAYDPDLRPERRPGRRMEREYDQDRDSRYYYGYMPSKSPLRFIPLVLVIALCVFGFIAAREICHDVPINSSDYSKMKYTVTEGLTDEQLAQDLAGMGIIDNQLIFRIRCRFYDADYVEGTYELSPCYSTEKIINILSGYTYGSD
ncbi:MAG: hypothetical protein IJJ17_07695 [Parasporobacterium sp.]|nr:hypothetical protein [Parasporobacterium sp.]